LARNFKVLTENAYPEENYFNFALGAENKKVNMFVEDNNQSQSSSILKPKLHLDQYPHIIFDQTEEVCMKRIDDLGIDFLSNLIVLDIQGYELEFFKGANRLLNQIDFILSEINREELYENCAQVDELDEYLKKFGFSRVFTDWAGGNWGDAFYMRKTRAL
jgi:FkbM family methyltransferase